MTSIWGQFGVDLGSIWGRSFFWSRSIWGQLGVDFGSTSGRHGVDVKMPCGRFWGRFEVSLGSLKSLFGVTLRSRSGRGFLRGIWGEARPDLRFRNGVREGVEGGGF